MRGELYVHPTHSEAVNEAAAAAAGGGRALSYA